MVNKEFNRLAQFAAFSPLKGYHELIAETERPKENRIELANDELDRLNAIINQMKKNDLVLVKYYAQDAYKTVVDKIIKIDPIYRKLHLATVKIPLQDILSIDYYIV